MEKTSQEVGKVTSVLLIDDDPVDRKLATRALKTCSLSTYFVQTTERLEDACQIAISNDFDVVLLDLGLPDSQGMETLREFRKAVDDVPVIVLTDMVDDNAAIGSFFQGAQDFLPKAELEVGSLSRSIQYAIQRHQLHRQLSKVNLELQEKNQQLQNLCDTAQRFVDNVSHEFRTPLTVIKEYVSLLREGVVGSNSLDSEQIRFLEIVEDRSEDLNTMVDDMLDVSKLQSGLLGCWRKTCSAASIVNRVLPAMERKSDVKDVKLTVQLEDDLPLLYCDPEKIGRVLINLVVNAIKFSGRPGKVELIGRIDSRGQQVLFQICDNGPGIDKARMGLIFERFKQLGTAARGSSKGFGLGLNIAKELVNLNLGEMSIDSELGKGSTFSFTVPVFDCPSLLGRYARRAGDSKSAGINLNQVSIDDRDQDFADDIDAVLNCLNLSDSLTIRQSDTHWLIASAAQTFKLEEQINQTIANTNRNRPHEPIPEIKVTHSAFVDGDDFEKTDWMNVENEFPINAGALLA